MKPEVRRSELLTTRVKPHEREIITEAAERLLVSQSELLRVAVMRHARDVLGQAQTGAAA